MTLCFFLIYSDLLTANIFSNILKFYYFIVFSIIWYNSPVVKVNSGDFVALMVTAANILRKKKQLKDIKIILTI